MLEPLNAVLYSFLKQKFGEVKVANEGCPAYYQRFPDPINSKRTVIRASSWGEYYCVRCPFCNDHSPRLWINHCYASAVEDGRRQLTHLATCYNNQCLEQPGRRQQLEHIIFGMGHHLRPRPCPIRPVTAAFEPKPVVPPGTVVPLSELPETHPAREYIKARGFDPDWLSMKFEIGLVADAAEHRFEIMRNRLYIPVRYRHELVGWQCRAISSDAAGPKYLNAPNMRKSTLLYNFDQAEQQPFVIVVEGVTSVWRLGMSAVCLFGKTMSMFQQNLLARTWGGKPVFLILDHDAKVEMEQAKALLAHHNMQVVAIELPDTRDPADYTVSDITTMLFDRASQAGVLSALM
jgi:hypothetical protein